MNLNSFTHHLPTTVVQTLSFAASSMPVPVEAPYSPFHTFSYYAKLVFCGFELFSNEVLVEQ